MRRYLMTWWYGEDMDNYMSDSVIVETDRDIPEEEKMKWIIQRISEGTEIPIDDIFPSEIVILAYWPMDEVDVVKM